MGGSGVGIGFVGRGRGLCWDGVVRLGEVPGFFVVAAGAGVVVDWNAGCE